MPNARAARDQEAPAEALAEREAREVAERRGQPGDEDDRAEVDAALRGDDAAEHDRRLARGDEADERAGLQEGERGDQRVGPGAERVGEVGEQALEVGQAHDARRHEGEGGRGQHADDQQAARDARGRRRQRRRRRGTQPHAASSAGSGHGRGVRATGAGAGACWAGTAGASSSLQRAIVRRSEPRATRPIGAGSQMAIAR